MPDTRTPIQPQSASGPEWAHLIPLVRALIDAGHEPLDHEDRYGFGAVPDGWICKLYGPITLEDWEMLNEHFIIPYSISYMLGMIRDKNSWTDIYGVRRDMVEGVE